jgi:hypothetical protein
MANPAILKHAPDVGTVALWRTRLRADFGESFRRAKSARTRRTPSGKFSDQGRGDSARAEVCPIEPVGRVSVAG